MTGSIAAVVVAAVAFIGAHFVLSSAPVRGPLTRRLGEGPFRGVFSVVAGGSLTWLILAYNSAPIVDIWPEPDWGRPLVGALMLLASVLLVASLTQPNPTLAGMEALGRGRPAAGILAVTRHPMLWAFALWGAGHAIVNGDAASLVLFGGITVLALGGMVHLDARKRAEGGDDWARLEAATSVIPFAAILAGRTSWSAARMAWWRLALGVVLYLALRYGHGPVIGVDPLAQ
jgi:uncharacterized membrane protein